MHPKRHVSVICKREFADSQHRPCNVVSGGSNFDDKFERAMGLFGCHSYVIDPTLRPFARVAEFSTRLQAYGATLNSSVGIGNGTLLGKPLVPIDRLLADKYADGDLARTV